VHGKAAFWSNQCESIWSKYCSTGPAHRLVSDVRSCRANVVSTPLMLEEWRATQASHRRMSSGLATSLAALFKLTPFSIPSFCATELHHRHLCLPLAAGLHHRTPLLFFLPDFAIAAVHTRHNSPHRLSAQPPPPPERHSSPSPLPPARVVSPCPLLENGTSSLSACSQRCPSPTRPPPRSGGAWAWPCRRQKPAEAIGLGQGPTGQGPAGRVAHRQPVCGLDSTERPVSFYYFIIFIFFI
jgi:hypothetical protein